MRLSVTTLAGMAALGASGLLAIPRPAAALEPPRPGELAKYEQDGTLAERQAFARELGNNRFDEGLVQDVTYRYRLEMWKQGLLGVEPTPPTGRRGMPTTGNVKVLALMIDFTDYLGTTTKAEVDAKLFGDGYPAGAPNPAAPVESLKNFYSRSSYGLLTLGGGVPGALGWYHHPDVRSTIPETYVGRQTLIKTALQSFDATTDFSEFDNDGDGDIDYLLVVWTGPDTGWSTFWWAYATSWYDPATPLTLDGKTLGKYSWQWEKNAAQGEPVFSAGTVIHETGHALGLPDYYDYDATAGPDGGIGAYDMMDFAAADHNAFSKWVLDWITPTIVAGGSNPFSLRRSDQYPDAVVFSKGVTSSIFQDLFIAQTRTRSTDPTLGNDSPWPSGAAGLLIYHADARLNAAGTNFAWDNSYTEHKLLRVMEGDGLEEIENSTGPGAYLDAGDLYFTGKTFGPATFPPATKYDNLSAWMEVADLSAAGSPMTGSINEVAVDVTAPTGAPGTPTDEGASKTGITATFTWTAATADPESALSYHLQVGTAAGGNDAFDGHLAWNQGLSKAIDATVNGATYYARVRAMNGAGLYGPWSGNSDGITVTWPSVDCNALDNCALAFDSPSAAPWFSQTATTHDGVDAAQSGDIADSEITTLRTDVTGPGTMTFWWKVSSEAGYDYLVAYLDAADPYAIAGEVDWTQVTLNVPAGAHTIRWQYEKDEAVSEGSDTGWVDQVVWTPTATGDPGSDFDANGKADVFWRSDSTGENAVWLMDGGSITGGAVLPTVPTPWSFEGFGDFNGDHKADVLFSNDTTREAAIWMMDGTTIASSTMLPNVPVAWHIDRAVGDFDGDGTEDLLLWNEATGQSALWFITNGTVSSTAMLAATSAQWERFLVGDFNGDGKADIFWRNPTTGENAIWLMNGGGIISGHVLTPVVTSWTPVDLGDFDGDAKADVLWRSNSTGEGAIWFMNGGTITSGALLPTVASPWSPQGVGDFDGGGQADIWWRNSTTGENAIWFMNGGTIESSAVATTVANTWSVLAP